MHTHFFLGANAPTGFYSLYDQLVDPHTDEALYILKGGPGSGKSSFLKTITKGLQDAGLAVEQIHCTAEPDSLDAIYIPALKTAYADGTSPHILEPAYMAVMDQYINLGIFYDTAALRPYKTEVIDKTRAYQTRYARAYDCLAAAKGVIGDLAAPLVDENTVAAVQKRTRGIIAREIGKKRRGQGKITYRFLTALTHRGYVTRFDTVEALATRVYHLDNNFGLAHHMLSDLVKAATDAGLDCVLCPSPMDPEVYEHLLIPALDLAFVSSNHEISYTGPAYRHIRLDAMVDRECLKNHRARIRFSKKVFALLISEVVTTLTEAKELYDEIEQLYNPHVDWDGVYALAEVHLQALLGQV
ncbi:MAG: hypothetical protein FWC72_00615 [Oscillospiraceae bacterium]|nr:hypothetical protein [Oscillospiraceae bacterium]